MNSGGNALGQGNRANATIGRALQLVIRNVGGGIPGEIDRAVFGNPGQVHVLLRRGRIGPDVDAAQRRARFQARARRPSRCSMATACRASPRANRARPKDWRNRSRWASRRCAIRNYAESSNAILVMSPDHYAIFQQGGWGRAEIEAGLREALRRPGRDLDPGRARHRRRHRSLAREGDGRQVQRGRPARRASRRPRRAHVRRHRRLARAAQEGRSANRYPGDTHMTASSLPHARPDGGTRRRNNARAGLRPRSSKT